MIFCPCLLFSCAWKTRQWNACTITELYNYSAAIFDIKFLLGTIDFIFHSFLDFPPFRFRQQKSFIRNFMVVKKATIIITRNINTSIKKYCHHESSDPGLLIVSSGLGCRIKYSIHQTARSTGCIGWSITKSCKWLMAVWYLNKEHYNLQIS